MGTAMSTVQSIYERAAADGPAILPAGPGVTLLLRWDPYKQYRESGANNYVWRVEVALLGQVGGAARVRQTITLHSHGLNRKHEMAFAFEMVDLANATVVAFPGAHPGPGRIVVPDMLMGTEQASVPCHGAPIGVELTFKTPITVRRWSCLPITPEVLDQEMTVFAITIWFARQETADYAAKVLLAQAHEDREPMRESSQLAPPRFDEFPSMPPGGISRG